MGATIFSMRLAELLVVVAILSLLSGISFYTFKKINDTKALETDAVRILSELNQARSLTLSSKNADQYGVHFASSSVTLFEGTSYSAGASGNVVSTLNSLVTIASTTLSGNALDVVFARLTGEASATGTIKVALVASSSVTRLLTIYQTGIVELQ